MAEKTKKARVIEINTQMRDILNKAKDENRALTEEEQATLEDLRQERNVLSTEIQIETSERYINALNSASPQDRAIARAFSEQVREMLRSGNRDMLIPQQRDTFVTTDATGMVPLTIGEVFGPLEKGLIMGSLGVRMQTGLVGDWDYPVVGPVEASINGETTDVAATKFDISKVSPKPNRCSLVIEVSNTAIDQTDGRLRDIILWQMPMAVERLLNNWMFKATEIATGVTGPFVSPKTSLEFAGDVPTYKELLTFKATVDKTGITPQGVGAFIMNNVMKANLESTPKDTGSGRMIIENGTINGTPVLVTEYVADDTVYFGYFGYTLVGQFGEVHMVVDPYTKASANIVRFILNTNYDIKAALSEAFGKLVKTA